MATDQKPGAKGAGAASGSFKREDTYSQLRIHKNYRTQLKFGVMTGMIVFSLIIFKDYKNPTRPWWVTGVPIVILGMMIACIPPSEEWEYKPWQARSRQYEKSK